MYFIKNFFLFRNTISKANMKVLSPLVFVKIVKKIFHF